MDWAAHMRPIFAQLGQDGTFAHAGGSPVPVRLIYQAPYVEIALGAGVESTYPRVAVMETDVPGIDHGDVFNVHGYGAFVVRTLERIAPAGMIECRVEVTEP